MDRHGDFFSLLDVAIEEGAEIIEVLAPKNIILLRNSSLYAARLYEDNKGAVAVLTGWQLQISPDQEGAASSLPLPRRPWLRQH